MSANMKVKALRVPCSVVGIDDIWAFCEEHEGEKDFDIGKAPGFRYPHFAPGCVAERDYLDLVLSEKVVPPEREHFAKHRKMKKKERRKYFGKFRKLFPELDPKAVRRVHYCFYDGVEPPDVYD